MSRGSTDIFLPLNLGAARRIAEEVFLAGDSLAHFPNRGRPGLLPGTRELVAAKPYVLIYRVSESEVRVLRV